MGSEICETKRFCMDGETNGRMQSIKEGININPPNTTESYLAPTLRCSVGFDTPAAQAINF